MQRLHLEICLVLKHFPAIRLDRWLAGRLHTWHQHPTRGGSVDVGYIRTAQSQNLRAVSLFLLSISSNKVSRKFASAVTLKVACKQLDGAEKKATGTTHKHVG